MTGELLRSRQRGFLQAGKLISITNNYVSFISLKMRGWQTCEKCSKSWGGCGDFMIIVNKKMLRTPNHLIVHYIRLKIIKKLRTAHWKEWSELSSFTIYSITKLLFYKLTDTIIQNSVVFLNCSLRVHWPKRQFLCYFLWETDFTETFPLNKLVNT